MYIIHEIQTNETSALLPPLVYTDKNEAEAAYHSKLASAAISSVKVHTVVMMDEYGVVLKNEFYKHEE